MQEFFLNVKDLTRHFQNEKYSKWFSIWSDASKELQGKFFEAKAAVHEALCDNIDTRTALDAVRDLVTNSNIYIRDHATTDAFDGLLLRRIATYITDLLHIFGAIDGPRGGIGFPIEGGSSDVSKQKLFDLNVIQFLKERNVPLHSGGTNCYAISNRIS